MPIIYIHGVATRDEAPREQVEAYLRRFIAPAIASDPENVEILYAYWGDIGARFRWGGASRPRSPLLGMGGAARVDAPAQAITVAELQEALKDLPEPPPTPAATGGLVAGGPGGGAGRASALRLKDLTPQQLSDLLVTTLQADISDPQQQTKVSLAADAVAHGDQTFPRLAGCADLDAEWALLETLIAEQMRAEDPLAGMGVPYWLQNVGDRLKEALSRGTGLPGFVATRVTAEFRKPLNHFITLFLGDVFTYLNERGHAPNPGAIPRRFLDALEKAKTSQQSRNGEPLIVLSHSMGGQIVYDVVTHFLPNLPNHADTRIDLWCATASQVGLFEELKLLLESDEAHKTGNPVPFPDQRHLRYWWNVWDHNDFISFTAKGIIAGVDDDDYNSGMSVVGAHGGYLKQPSFFRAFAGKVKQALS